MKVSKFWLTKKLEWKILPILHGWQVEVAQWIRSDFFCLSYEAHWLTSLIIWKSGNNKHTCTCCRQWLIIKVKLVLSESIMKILGSTPPVACILIRLWFWLILILEAGSVCRHSETLTFIFNIVEQTDCLTSLPLWVVLTCAMPLDQKKSALITVDTSSKRLKIGPDVGSNEVPTVRWSDIPYILVSDIFIHLLIWRLLLKTTQRMLQFSARAVQQSWQVCLRKCQVPLLVTAQLSFQPLFQIRHIVAQIAANKVMPYSHRTSASIFIIWKISYASVSVSKSNSPFSHYLAEVN